MNEVIILSQHDDLTKEVEQLTMLIRAIPFLDSHEFYKIMCSINKIIDMLANSNLNTDSQQFKELKLKLVEVLFNEN